jgi:hypothetical protein
MWWMQTQTEELKKQEKERNFFCIVRDAAVLRVLDRRTRQLCPKETTSDKETSNIRPSAQERKVPFASYFLKPSYSDTSHQREDQQYQENQA